MVIHGLFVVMWTGLAIQRNNKHITQRGTGSGVSVSVTHGQVAGPTAKMANRLSDSCGCGSLTDQKDEQSGKDGGRQGARKGKGFRWKNHKKA